MSGVTQADSRNHDLPLLAEVLLSAFVTVLVAGTATAHPLAAARTEHPVVPTVDLVTTNASAEELLARRGLLLLAELNCTACHAAPAPWRGILAPVAPRSLVGVGSRLGPDALQKFIGDPQQHKGGTKMPALLDATSDAVRIDELVAYLTSLREELPPAPPGDATRGKLLYHSAGCVACHAPASDARPAHLPAEQELVPPENASVPLALSIDYTSEALVHFLRDPLRHRPGGRMPNLHLSEQESADIAAYLQGGRTPAASGPAVRSSAERSAKGKAQFTALRCNACHDTGEAMAPTEATPLGQGKPDRGCLSTRQTDGIPYFGLSAPQRRAIQNAFSIVQAGAPKPRSANEEIAWQFARLNCYACHARDGVGGPEAGRAAYFGANDAGAEALGELAHIPPKLDRVGRKLTRGWFEKILWGSDGGVRPYMNTRMPDFGRAQTEPLIAWLNEADRRETPLAIDVSGLLGHQRAEIGRKLLGIGGLACVSCHGLKDRKALGPPVIRLTHTTERLRPEYFKELVLNPQVTQPGTVMPPLLLGRKTADKDIESLWTYLKELGAHPMPEGLASEGDYELKPATGGRPIVFRSFIEGVGTHAIAVGYPQGLHAAFDAKSCRWALLWKGRFLDAMSNFQDRAMKPIKPLGTDLKLLPTDAIERVFRGYRLEKDGTPVMLYTESGATVEDTLRPGADGKAFERVRRTNSQDQKETVTW